MLNKKILLIAVSVILCGFYGYARTGIDTLPITDVNTLNTKTSLYGGDKVVILDSVLHRFQNTTILTLSQKVQSLYDTSLTQSKALTLAQLLYKVDKTSYLTDTATMLAKKDTAKFANGIRASITAGGGTYTGTSGVIVSGSVIKADTTLLPTYAYLNAQNANNVKYTDTSNLHYVKFANKLNVTDTTNFRIYSTALYQNKASYLSDSATFESKTLANAQLAYKLNITDTTFLARKVDVFNSLQLKKDISAYNSDTTTLLAKRDTQKFANGIRASIAAGTSGVPSRIQSGNANIKYWVTSGTPTVSYSSSGGVGTISVSGGTVELNRVQVDVTSSDLSSDAFTLVAPIANSGSQLQYPAVTKINRQLGGAPSAGFEHIYSISNNPLVQITAGTAGSTISVQVKNVSVMNTTASFVYNF